jgi:hypothetical protein
MFFKKKKRIAELEAIVKADAAKLIAYFNSEANYKKELDFVKADRTKLANQVTLLTTELDIANKSLIKAADDLNASNNTNAKLTFLYSQSENRLNIRNNKIKALEKRIKALMEFNDGLIAAAEKQANQMRTPANKIMSGRVMSENFGHSVIINKESAKKIFVKPKRKYTKKSTSADTPALRTTVSGNIVTVTKRKYTKKAPAKVVVKRKYTKKKK